jgi:hypothetical protein
LETGASGLARTISPIDRPSQRPYVKDLFGSAIGRSFVNCPRMAAELRELSFVTPARLKASLLRTLVISVAVGLILGLLGPFGTFERMSAVERHAFWLLIILAGSLIHTPLFWIGAYISQTKQIPPWLWVPLAAAVAAAPTVLLVNGLASAMFGPIRLDGFFALYPYVLAISLPMMTLAYVTERASRSAVDPPPAPAPRPAPPTAPVAASSTPDQLGRDLLCLEMEDHYVRVHTALGSHLMLMRMSDAEAELDGLDGMRVHRSWWVARTAVQSWSRDGKSVTLTLSNGQSVPVARDRQPLVKAAGWLAG